MDDRRALLDHIQAHPIEGSIAEQRAAFAARLSAPTGGMPAIVGGIDGLKFGSGDIGALWFHGGGYVLGSPETHVAPVQLFAQQFGRSVFVPRYRRAPEHVWPAQLEDALAAVDALDGPLTLAGDSAGGHLALICALRRPDRVGALALFSPNTDRTGLSDTRAANTPLDAMNSDEGDRDMFRIAMPDLPPQHPDASPLLADLSALPPTYLAASEGEVLLGDTLLLARKLEALGVEHKVEIISYDDAGIHMFQNWPDALSAGRDSLVSAVEFLGQRLSGPDI